MQRPPIRVFAVIHDLDVEQGDALARDFPFEEVIRDGNAMELEYEGVYFPVDEFVEALTPLVTGKVVAHVDAIDNDAWTITRYKITAEETKTRTVDIDNVMEGL